MKTDEFSLPGNLTLKYPLARGKNGFKNVCGLWSFESDSTEDLHLFKGWLESRRFGGLFSLCFCVNKADVFLINNKGRNALWIFLLSF
jgi:hypothetical protein